MAKRRSGWPDVLHAHGYARRPSLVLVGGLAEQTETWYRNHRCWRRYFDVSMPNLLVYDGAALHRRIDLGLPITVDYLSARLHRYLEEFVQAPPYQLVASSLGCRIAIKYAVRFPDRVSRLVLLGPSGLGDKERLPVLDGVCWSNPPALVHSVFFDPRRVDQGLVRYYQRQFAKRRWRLGLIRTIRGTMDYGVRDLLARVVQPTLVVSGLNDRIADPRQAEEAVRLLPRGTFVLLPRCGHAPQIEKARLINRLVVEFLHESQPYPYLGSAPGRRVFCLVRRTARARS